METRISGGTGPANLLGNPIFASVRECRLEGPKCPDLKALYFSIPLGFSMPQGCFCGVSWARTWLEERCSPSSSTRPAG